MVEYFDCSMKFTSAAVPGPCATIWHPLGEYQLCRLR